MRVLVACEHSGAVRDAFIRRGHFAISCDLIATVAPGPHYKGDVRNILQQPWDLLIAHPPCTYLCASGLHWNKRRPERNTLTLEAIEFAKLLIDSPEVVHIPKRVAENPIGILSTVLRKPDQIIHPWAFGHDASKKTCLWLHGVPKLVATRLVLPRLVNGKARWANQTDSGQNNLPPSINRWQLRSETYAGIAEAMAQQWG